MAVDRLIGLASANRSLIGSMEEGRLAVRMKPELLAEHLDAVCRVLIKLLDVDIFPWLEAGKAPSDRERDRASTIVADRLCGAVAKESVRSARKIQQLSVLSVFLDSRGYRQVLAPGEPHYEPSEPGTYRFFATIPAVLGKYAFLWVDALVQPIESRADDLPILLQVESHTSFAEAARRRGAHHDTADGLRMTYGDDLSLTLMLGGYFGGDYLGTQAAEGVDWVWQHRMGDMVQLGI